MKAIRNQIEQWRDTLLLPNHNDILYHLISHKNAFPIDEYYKEDSSFFVPENSFLKKCVRQHLLSIKENGSPIFGIAKHKLIFNIADKSYEIPFLIASASVAFYRINKSYQIFQTEDFIVNPVLLSVLEQEHDFTTIEEVENLFDSFGVAMEVEEGVWVANLHPYRFVLHKEFDDLLSLSQFSNPLISLFGEAAVNIPLELSKNFLFPADSSQLQVFEKVATQNLVLQGPPGTGKSQVISNTIGKILGRGKKALLVAEKKVALEVVYHQMQQKGLHYFCVLYHHELKSKHFIASLLKTWRFVEDLPKKIIVLNQQAEMLTQGLNLTFNRLRQEHLIGGVSFSEFKAEFKNSSGAVYLDKKPTIPEWKKDKEILWVLKKNNFDLYGLWLSVKSEDSSYRNLGESIQKGIHLIKKLPKSDLTLIELQTNLKLSGLVSLFYYQNRALPQHIFEKDSRKQKQFLVLYQKIKTLTEKQALLEDEEKHWSKSFSLSELQEYIAALSSTNCFNIRSRLTKMKLLKFTDLNFVEGKKALQNLMDLKTIQKEIVEVREKLRKLEVPEDMPALNSVFYALSRIQALDENEVQLLFKLSNKERSYILKNATLFNDIYHLLKSNFNLQEEESLIRQLEELRLIVPILVENATRLQEISQATKLSIQNTTHLEETEASIYHSHWLDFKGMFPELAEMEGDTIQTRIENIIQVFDRETDAFSLFIQQQIKTRFDHYHTLLETPAKKLSEEEKLLKKELRKGKSILVKAFDRKRIFPSVRELLESEARHWIELLHPFFLCSPYSVAKSLPLDFKFDLGIFDEASQIPIAHIVGSVQRCERVIISGDQQQMAPQFYFQKKGKFQSDTLHHASFYWENTFLTHHYRSLHAPLIAFSNRYFYDNKLQTFPVRHTEYPITLIQVEGVFKNRRNEEEAEVAAKIISKKIEDREFDFGLVAFSQAQLDAILEKIPDSLLALLEDQHTVFIQSLEHVQGDECVHLIISMGYAKDEEGKFHKRFGPLNQEQGHRRLNVLMSRAISKITFIRSVTSEDFAISTNPGVDMLRKLMLFLEADTLDTQMSFPENIQQKEDVLTIQNIAHAYQDAQEIIDFYRIATARGWKIAIEI